MQRLKQDDLPYFFSKRDSSSNFFIKWKFLRTFMRHFYTNKNNINCIKLYLLVCNGHQVIYSCDIVLPKWELLLLAFQQFVVRFTISIHSTLPLWIIRIWNTCNIMGRSIEKITWIHMLDDDNNDSNIYRKKIDGDFLYNLGE